MLAAALWFVGAGAAYADLRVQVEESVNNATPVPVTHWFGEDRTMRDDGNRYIITSLQDVQSTIVDREARTYQTVPLELRPSASLPEVTVTRTEDIRLIGEWKARRYRLSGPATRELTIDIWITPELDTSFAQFRELMIKLGNRAGSEWLKAYEVIEGFPVLQQVQLKRPGISLKSESRVISIDQATPEGNTYEPPDGYKRIP